MALASRRTTLQPKVAQTLLDSVLWTRSGAQELSQRLREHPP